VQASPKKMTGDPYERPEAGPESGPTLCTSRRRCNGALKAARQAWIEEDGSGDDWLVPTRRQSPRPTTILRLVVHSEGIEAIPWRAVTPRGGFWRGKTNGGWALTDGGRLPTASTTARARPCATSSRVRATCAKLPGIAIPRLTLDLRSGAELSTHTLVFQALPGAELLVF
jgi:hypothetical protein